MATPSQTATALRANLKDYNDFPGSIEAAPVTITTYKGAINEVKLKSIDAINRKAAHAVKTSITDPVTGVVTSTTVSSPYTLPVQTVITENATTVFQGLIDSAAAKVATAQAAYVADRSKLSDLEMAAEKFEFIVQLWSGFKALANVALYKVTGAGEADYSYVVTGETGTGINLYTIIGETLINA